jgi:hypothetical protein
MGLTFIKSTLALEITYTPAPSFPGKISNVVLKINCRRVGKQFYG